MDSRVPAVDAPPGVTPDTGTVPPGTDSGPLATDSGRDARIVRPDGGPVEDRPDCGTVTTPAGTSLRRHPYIQSTTQTSVRLAWTTTGSAAGTPRIRYRLPNVVGWTDGPAITDRVFTTAQTADTTDYVAHDGTITGLTSGTFYCYEILDGATVLATGTSFQTAWMSDRVLRILAFGDSGTGDANQRNLRDRMLTEDFDIFLHLGDMAYNTGTYVEFETHVFDIYRDFMSFIPTFPAPGNHEYIAYAPTARAYFDVYYLPEHALVAADQEHYYSFDYGNVHVVSLDSNPEFLGSAAAPNQRMLDWAAADLAASNATWKIAIMHHPTWTSGIHGNAGEINPVRALILPVLEAGGIDLVLAGHDHHYERSNPMIGTAAQPANNRAITYIVAGGAGAALRAVNRTNPPYGSTAAVNDNQYTYLTFDILGCNGYGRSVTTDGNVVDEFSIDGCD